jgi:hypothetical protein
VSRTCGRVLGLDVTECRDGIRLADRITERIREKAGLHTDIALEWADIQHRSTKRVTLDQDT